jgi:hypothetical protein
MKTRIINEQGGLGGEFDEFKQEPEKTTEPENKNKTVVDPDRNKKKKKQDFNTVSGLTPRAAALKKHVLSLPEFSADKWSAIGGYSNRNIGQTDKLSQHAKGNALDWHGAKGNLDPIMKKLADWLVSNAGQFHVQNIIYNKMIWNWPTGWHSYPYKKIPGGSPHTDHVHVDFIESNKKSTIKADQAKIHKYVQQARWSLYNMITKYPERYFQNFKAWTINIGSGRNVGTDNEKGAANYLTDTWEEYWGTGAKTYDLRNALKYAHPHDRENIKTLIILVNLIALSILKGESKTWSVPFWNYDESTETWKQVKRTYRWDYM